MQSQLDDKPDQLRNHKDQSKDRLLVSQHSLQFQTPSTHSQRINVFFEVYAHETIIQRNSGGNRMFTENASSTQQTVIQIAPALAILLTLLVGVTCAALGAFISWWINGREMRHTKNELSEVRTIRESALNMRRLALEERDRTSQEYVRLQAEAQSLRRQLDQAQAVARAAETQLEELKATVRATRRQAEESQNELITMEEQWNFKNQSIARLQAQNQSLQNSLDEARKQLNERYLTITALNAQLQEYRTRANESNSVVASLQSAFAELSRRLQQQSLRMTGAELRTNDVQFQATTSAEIPLRTQRTPVTATESPLRSQSVVTTPHSTTNSDVELITPTPAASTASTKSTPHSDFSAPSQPSEDISELENRLLAMLEELKR